MERLFMTKEEHSMPRKLKVFQKVKFLKLWQSLLVFLTGTAGLVFLGGLTDIKIIAKLIWKATNQSWKILPSKCLQRSFKNYIFSPLLSPETYLNRFAPIALSQDHNLRSKSLIYSEANGLIRMPRGTRWHKLHTKRCQEQQPGHNSQVNFKFLILR